MTEEMKTYQLEFSSRGPIQITIPATWKITFGAVVPGKGGGAQFGSFGVRIWESTDKQRAVFPDVVSMYDTSLDIKAMAVRKYGTEDWYEDDGKTWEGANAELVEKAWKAPTEITDGEPPWKPQPDADIPWQDTIKRRAAWASK